MQLGLFATLLWSVGCSPPADTAQHPEQHGRSVQLSVGPAAGNAITNDSEPIAPPYLTDIDGTSARTVAMRFGDGDTRFIQKRGPVEVVPTPTPDGVPEAKTGKKPEVIPTPDGVPESDPKKKMPVRVSPKPNADSADADPTKSPEMKRVKSEFPDGIDGPEDFRTWPIPSVSLVITGRQHGYIEPCGCTGLDRQKGGVARRFTFMRQLRDKGWNLMPLDAGDQVRRFGRQAEVKLQHTSRALKQMRYEAVGFGPDDLRLGVGELLSVAAAGELPEDNLYVSANVVLIDPSLMPQSKVVERNGLRIGITSLLDPDGLKAPPPREILVNAQVEAAQKSLTELAKSSPDFNVLLFFGTEKAGQKLVSDVPGFDLLVAAGGYGEPTYQAETIEGSDTRMIVTGNKGMYAGLVGIYPDQPMKYARVPLTHEFEDAPEMRKLMKEYQDQLRDIGLEGLGLLPPIPHSSGQKFIGTAKCGECHKTAYEIWQGTPHADATADIVSPPKERSDIARHFDPECISCHVTGWNPQEYYPYESGYLSLEASEHLTGNGCENCHGPGSQHADAEQDGSNVAVELRNQLRDAMKLPLEKAREQCMKCHDLDNSPDFHEDDAFEDIYWPEVEHYGID